MMPVTPKNCPERESDDSSSISFDNDYPSVAVAILFVIGVFLLYMSCGVAFSLLRIPGHFSLLVLQWGIFLVLPILVVRSLGNNPRTTFSMRRPSARGAGLTLLLVVPLFVILIGVATIQDEIIKAPQWYVEQFEELIVVHDIGTFLLVVFAVSIMPGICEEMLFRGFLQSSLHTRYLPGKVIIITSLCFGIFHVDPYNFVGVTVLALYMGYILYRTRCIFYCMLSHAGYNFCVIVFFNSGLGKVMQEWGPIHIIGVMCLALPLLLIGCRMLCKMESSPSPGWISHKKSGLTYCGVRE